MNANYRNEFPDYGPLPASIAAALADGKLIDVSYHNDAAPSFIRASDAAKVDADGSAENVPVLWCDYEDDEKREISGEERFMVHHQGSGFNFNTDDEAKALECLHAFPFVDLEKNMKDTDAALVLLRVLHASEVVWHFDDDAADIYSTYTGKRTFTDDQAKWCDSFVERLNTLFMPLVPASERHLINAGAWHAAGLVNWGGVS